MADGMDDANPVLRTYGAINGPFTTKDTSNICEKLFLKEARVNVISWTSEDIAQYKLDKNLKKFDDGYSKPALEVENEPPLKKSKMEGGENDNLKLDLPRKNETGTLKSQFKTGNAGQENGKNSIKEKRNKKINIKNEKKIIKNYDQDNEKKNDENIKQYYENIHQDMEEKNDKYIDQKNETKNNEIYDQIDTNFENVKLDIKKRNDEHIDEENEKKNDENIDQVNVMLFDTSNSDIDILKTVSNEPIETTKSASTSKVGMIQCRAISNLMEVSYVEKYCDQFNLSQTVSKPAKESVIKQVSESKSSTAQDLKTEDLTISDIELLYQKYFNKNVHDTIFISANILNFILISDQHYKTRMIELKLLEDREKASNVYLKHKQILESQLKKYLLEIIPRFSYSEFEPVFKIFFLSILSVIKTLDQQNCNKSDMYKNVMYLLRIILMSSNLNTEIQSLTEKMLLSKTFIHECYNLISVVKENQDKDPGLTNRLSIFFTPPVHQKKYFQTALDALTGDSEEDLNTLINNAAYKFYENSKIKSSMELPTYPIIKENLTVKTPVTSMQSISKSNDLHQRFTVPNGTKRPVPNKTLPDDKSKANPPIIIIDPPEENLKTNIFVEEFSTALLNDTTAETAMPTLKLPRVTTVNFKQSVSGSSLKKETAFKASKPSFETAKSISSKSLKPEVNKTLPDDKSKANPPIIIIDPPEESLKANIFVEEFSTALLNDTTAETAMPTLKLPQVTTVNFKQSVFGSSLKKETAIKASKPSFETVKSISSKSLKPEVNKTLPDDKSKANPPIIIIDPPEESLKANIFVEEFSTALLSDTTAETAMPTLKLPRVTTVNFKQSVSGSSMKKETAIKASKPSFETVKSIPSKSLKPEVNKTLPDDKSKTNPPIIIIDPPEESLKANIFVEEFSTALLNDTTAETAMPTLKLPRVTTVNFKQSVSGSSLKNETAIKASKPSFETAKSMSSEPLKHEDNKVIIKSVQHEEVKKIQHKEVKNPVIANHDIFMASKRPTKKPTISLKCYGMSCQNDAKIFCGKCHLVKYCSKKCQDRDWYQGAHKDRCRFLSILKQRQKDSQNRSF